MILFRDCGLGVVVYSLLVCYHGNRCSHWFNLHRVDTNSFVEVKGSNGGPVAIVGPDRRLFLPVDSLLLDGSGSTDDRGIASYRWDAVR